MEEILSTRVRLGRFELNLDTGELRSIEPLEGVVLLREQPFQILKLLVERQGKIVTRAELRQRLWPNDTVVNFDQGINAAIRILRRELDDSADTPRFIETLARRGYRLIVVPESVITRAGAAPHRAKSLIRPAGPLEIVGQEVSHYRLLEVIGRGGMGMVYRAEDIKLGRQVALKFLPEDVADDPNALLRFEREARTASALNHPNICTIYEIEEHDGQPFIAMELLQGESLQHRLERAESKILPLAELFVMSLQVCDGLRAAHEKGIVHRDIKPANIFLTESGQAKILDFGIAKLAIESNDPRQVAETLAQQSPGTKAAKPLDDASQLHALSVTGPAIGTVGYMSPEQIEGGALDQRTDLYSFGLVLHEATTGRRPADTASKSLVGNSSQMPVPVPVNTLVPGVPRALATVIVRAVSADRSRRYQSAAAMRQALEQAKRKATFDTQRKRLVWVVVVAIVVCFASVVIWQGVHRKSGLSAGDAVVLAATNHTEDAAFNDGLYAGLYWSLKQSPFVHPLDERVAVNALGELHLSLQSLHDPQTSLQICSHVNARVVLAASIAQDGERFRVGESAFSCKTTKIIAHTEELVASRSAVIHAIGELTSTMRRNLGEPAAAVQQYGKPLDIALSSSPEAIQLSTDGLRSMIQLDYPAAKGYLQRAVAIDHEFAAAYSFLASAEGNLGETKEASEASKQAYSLRQRAIEPTRLNIEDNYYENTTGELDKAVAVLFSWEKQYPDDFIAHNNLGRILGSLGQVDKSLVELREAARIEPGQFSYQQVLSLEESAGRPLEAKATLDELRAKGLSGSTLHLDSMIEATLEDDTSAIHNELEWARHDPLGYLVLGPVAAYDGRGGKLRASLSEAKAAIAGSERQGDDATKNRILSDVVGQFSLLGQPIHDGFFLKRIQSNPRRRRQVVTSAMLAANNGDVARTEELTDSLNGTYPLATLVQYYEIPTIRALLCIRTSNPACATSVLEAVKPYDLADPDDMHIMYAAYFRGLAYLQRKEPALAAAEFHKIVDSPTRAAFDLVDPLARLQLARAETLQGDRVRALKTYAVFLDQWRDADPEIPIYVQARAEYKQLAASI